MSCWESKYPINILEKLSIFMRIIYAIVNLNLEHFFFKPEFRGTWHIWEQSLSMKDTIRSALGQRRILKSLEREGDKEGQLSIFSLKRASSNNRAAEPSSASFKVSEKLFSLLALEYLIQRRDYFNAFVSGICVLLYSPRRIFV